MICLLGKHNRPVNSWVLGAPTPLCFIVPAVLDGGATAKVLGRDDSHLDPACTYTHPASYTHAHGPIQLVAGIQLQDCTDRARYGTLTQPIENKLYNIIERGKNIPLYTGGARKSILPLGGAQVVLAMEAMGWWRRVAWVPTQMGTRGMNGEERE